MRGRTVRLVFGLPFLVSRCSGAHLSNGGHEARLTDGWDAAGFGDPALQAFPHFLRDLRCLL
jgi:hypothetical protein